MKKTLLVTLIISVCANSSIMAQTPPLSPVVIPPNQQNQNGNSSGSSNTTGGGGGNVQPTPPIGLSPNQGATINFKGKNYNAFLIKIDPANLKKISILENSTNLPHQDFLKSQVALHSNIYLTNGGFYDNGGKPVGYYVKDSKKVQDVNIGSGPGNFFIKPNGAFIITDNDAMICESSQIQNAKNVSLGIQNGPMLVNNGQVNPAFATFPKQYLKSGVGIYTVGNDKFIVFATSNVIVTYSEFASLFKDYFNCDNALLLGNSNAVSYYPNETNPNAQFNPPISLYMCYQY